MARKPSGQLPTLKQGETLKVVEYILDDDGSAPNLSAGSANDVIVDIRKNGESVVKFSRDGSGGFGSLTVDGTETNKLTFWITREMSKDFEKGVHDGVCIVEFADTDAPNNERHEEYDICGFNVLEGKAKDEAI